MYRYKSWILFFFVGLLASCGSGEEGRKQELKRIEGEIEVLQKKSKEYRLRSFKETMEAQEDMLTNWKGFAENTEEAEKFDKQADQVEERLNKLLQKRQELLRSLQEED